MHSKKILLLVLSVAVATPYFTKNSFAEKSQQSLINAYKRKKAQITKKENDIEKKNKEKEKLEQYKDKLEDTSADKYKIGYSEQNEISVYISGNIGGSFDELNLKRDEFVDVYCKAHGTSPKQIFVSPYSCLNAVKCNDPKIQASTDKKELKELLIREKNLNSEIKNIQNKINIEIAKCPSKAKSEIINCESSSDHGAEATFFASACAEGMTSAQYKTIKLQITSDKISAIESEINNLNTELESLNESLGEVEADCKQCSYLYSAGQQQRVGPMARDQTTFEKVMLGIGVGAQAAGSILSPVMGYMAMKNGQDTYNAQYAEYEQNSLAQGLPISAPNPYGGQMAAQMQPWQIGLMSGLSGIGQMGMSGAGPGYGQNYNQGYGQNYNQGYGQNYNGQGGYGYGMPNYGNQMNASMNYPQFGNSPYANVNYGYPQQGIQMNLGYPSYQNSFPQTGYSSGYPNYGNMNGNFQMPNYFGNSAYPYNMNSSPYASTNNYPYNNSQSGQYPYNVAGMPVSGGIYSGSYPSYAVPGSGVTYPNMPVNQIQGTSLPYSQYPGGLTGGTNGPMMINGYPGVPGGTWGSPYNGQSYNSPYGLNNYNPMYNNFYDSRYNSTPSAMPQWYQGQAQNQQTILLNQQRSMQQSQALSGDYQMAQVKAYEAQLQLQQLQGQTQSMYGAGATTYSNGYDYGNIYGYGNNYSGTNANASFQIPGIYANVSLAGASLGTRIISR